MRDHKSPVDRVKARILERFNETDHRPASQRKTQAGLAKFLTKKYRIPVSRNAINELLHGESTSRGLLAYLDGIAEYLERTTSDLVRRSDTFMLELRKNEYKALAYWRSLDEDVQDYVLAALERVGRLSTEEREARRWWSKLRQVRDSSDLQDIERTVEDVLRKQRQKRAGNSEPAVLGPVPTTAHATLPPKARSKSPPRVG